MNYFGDSNERGEPNYKRALEFFESSKEKGFTDAIYYLGFFNFSILFFKSTSFLKSNRQVKCITMDME